MQEALNQRQERFCIEYLKTGDQTQSAIVAGYKESSASTQYCIMMKRPEIKARIEQLRGKVEKKTVDRIVMDVNRRKERLSSIADKEGPASADQIAIKAINELNKMEGAHSPAQVQVTGANGGPVELQVDAKGKLISMLNSLASRESESGSDTEP